MLKDGFSGPLGLLRDYYPVDMHRAILTQAFEMGLSMAGQLWWRFLQYESFPRRLVGMIHPSLSKQSQYQYAVSFCALRSCCRDVHMGAKVHTLLPTPQALFKDSNFRKLLVMWVIAYKFTNMICERLLAQIRQACDGDNADIERVCASGLLSQALTDHRQLGREDPRYKTRSQLLEDGVPLKCAVKKSPGVPCSGFMTWFHKQEPSKYFTFFFAWRVLLPHPNKGTSAKRDTLSHKRPGVSIKTTYPRNACPFSRGQKYHPPCEGTVSLARH